MAPFDRNATIAGNSRGDPRSVRRRTAASGLARAVLVVAAAGVAACSTWPSGPKFPDDPAARTGVPADVARLAIYRTAESSGYGQPPTAKLALDGAVLGDLWKSEYFLRDVAPGRHVLRVDVPANPGACELAFEIDGGMIRYFAVEPRPSYAWATMPGQVLWHAVPLAGIVIGPLAGAAGAAIESSGKACGGPFAVVEVDRDTALPKLADTQAEK
jgi:hypothetical protein